MHLRGQEKTEYELKYDSLRHENNMLISGIKILEKENKTFKNIKPEIISVHDTVQVALTKMDSMLIYHTIKKRLDPTKINVK